MLSRKQWPVARSKVHFLSVHSHLRGGVHTFCEKSGEGEPVGELPIIIYFNAKTAITITFISYANELEVYFYCSALSAALSHYETIKSTYVRTRLGAGARARAKAKARGGNTIKSEAWAGAGAELYPPSASTRRFPLHYSPGDPFCERQ